MSQSHLSTMSCKTTSDRPPHSPCSVNYITANTETWSRHTQQPTIVSAPPRKYGRRVQFRARAKKAFTSAKKSLKVVSTFVRPRHDNSAAATTSFKTLSRAGSRLSMHVRQSVIETPANRASTPSVCVTKPTFKGSNVRLSIYQAPPPLGSSQIVIPTYSDSDVRLSVHRVPPTPQVSQTFPLEEGDKNSAKRKSMRFDHPVVNDVVVAQSTSNRDSSGQETIVSDSTSLSPATPTTVATVDFEAPINPKRVYQASQAAGAGESFHAFKDVMDGVRDKSPPRAELKPQAAPPSLPYIALAPAMQLDIGGDESSVKTVAPSAEEQAPAMAAAVPETAEYSHPNTLTLGVGRPLRQPRTTAPRPHTTGKFFPGTNLLPYIPYNPRFNPYDRSPSLAPRNALYASQKSSTSDLATAFAEAEAAEQEVRHKRHTTLYADVEAGLVYQTVATAAPVHQIKRKPVPTATAGTAPARAPARAPGPIPVPAPAPVPTPAPLNVRTSKPLPPTPSASSPRRYTHGIVPPRAPVKDDDVDIPMKSLMEMAEESERTRENESEGKSKGVGRRLGGLHRLMRKLRS